MVSFSTHPSVRTRGCAGNATRPANSGQSVFRFHDNFNHRIQPIFKIAPYGPAHCWWGVRMLRFAGLFFVVVAMPAPALAAECTMAQLGISPFSVIEPCSKRLALPDLAGRDRSLTHFVRGRGYHRTQRLDDAARDYGKAFELDPKNADILVSWANADLRQQRYREYVARVEQAFELDPD